MNHTIRKQLIDMVDEGYQEFLSSLIPNINNILGVRLPELRKLAKNIAKGDWRTYLKHAENKYFEETMLQGLVIGYVRTDIEEILPYIADSVPRIDNWSVCDSFCIGLKFTRNHREKMWEFLQPYLKSDEEYEIRFAVVMLLSYFVEEEYFDRVLPCLDRIDHEGYYVKMAVAWAISVCYVKYPELTMVYLKDNALDDDTYNKALQKIIESSRIDSETKKVMRSMKRRR